MWWESRGCDDHPPVLEVSVTFPAIWPCLSATFLAHSQLSKTTPTVPPNQNQTGPQSCLQPQGFHHLDKGHSSRRVVFQGAWPWLYSPLPCPFGPQHAASEGDLKLKRAFHSSQQTMLCPPETALVAAMALRGPPPFTSHPHSHLPEGLTPLASSCPGLGLYLPFLRSLQRFA